MATNISVLTGRLTKDPVVTQTQAGGKIARFNLAVKRDYKNKETNQYDSDFIPVTVFNSALVEHIVEPYIKQGSQITVSGRLQSGSYTNKEGSKVYTLDLNVSSIDLSPMTKSDAQSQTSQTPLVDTPANGGFMDISAEDYAELLP